MSDPVLLICERAGSRERAPEAEPVLVERDGDVVSLVLDDGERLTFDAQEIAAALRDAA